MLCLTAALRRFHDSRSGEHWYMSTMVSLRNGRVCLIAMLRPSVPFSKNLSETVHSNQLQWVSDHGDIARQESEDGGNTPRKKCCQDFRCPKQYRRSEAFRQEEYHRATPPCKIRDCTPFPAGFINGEFLGKAVKVDNGTTACNDGWLSCPSNGVTLLSLLDFSLENGAKVDLHDEYCSRKALLFEDPGTILRPLSRWRHCL